MAKKLFIIVDNGKLENMTLLIETAIFNLPLKALEQNVDSILHMLSLQVAILMTVKTQDPIHVVDLTREDVIIRKTFMEATDEIDILLDKGYSVSLKYVDYA